MHSSIIIVHRECGELAETEVCIVHVYQIEELHESEWRTCRTLHLKADEIFDELYWYSIERFLTLSIIQALD